MFSDTFDSCQYLRCVNASSLCYCGPSLVDGMVTKTRVAFEIELVSVCVVADLLPCADVTDSDLRVAVLFLTASWAEV